MMDLQDETRTIVRLMATDLAHQAANAGDSVLEMKLKPPKCGSPQSTAVTK